MTLTAAIAAAALTSCGESADKPADTTQAASTAGTAAVTESSSAAETSATAATTAEAEAETAATAEKAENDTTDATAGAAENYSSDLYFMQQPIVDSPEWVTKLDALKDCEQIIVVAGVDKSTAYISMHEKNADGKWQQLISTPGFTGLEGIGRANCRQAITPVGTFTIDKASGLADDPGCQMEYTKCDDNYYWSGDAREGMHFNELVNINDVPGLDPEECEHIADYEYPYRYCLNMGWNSDEMDPENGCAFFFHCHGTQKPYTGGCVSVSEPVMKFIMQHVKPGCKITIDSFENLGAEFG